MVVATFSELEFGRFLQTYVKRDTMSSYDDVIPSGTKSRIILAIAKHLWPEIPKEEVTLKFLVAMLMKMSEEFAYRESG